VLPQLAAVDYVLTPPGFDARRAIHAAIDRALDAWPSIATGDFERAMHMLHTKEKP
jgi:PTH1 family peptidyl-tRNA hydrolase